jgi:aerobic-type carbon monoxide dehydrogenase small subunit (CoxS/CutS family)
MPERLPIRFELDGMSVSVAVDPLTPLTTALADELAQHSVVEPCAVGACGACTVLLDGDSVLACLTPVGFVEDRSVTTIHGLPEDDPVMAAYVAANAFQCGYCTPGFVLATHALRGHDDGVDRESIVAGLAGNLCRCSSYKAILAAAQAARTRAR